MLLLALQVGRAVWRCLRRYGWDFMKPRIQEVDQLLELGVNITIYNGQVTRN